MMPALGMEQPAVLSRDPDVTGDLQLTRSTTPPSSHRKLLTLLGLKARWVAQTELLSRIHLCVGILHATLVVLLGMPTSAVVVESLGLSLVDACRK
jgi:hypothetical protein